MVEEAATTVVGRIVLPFIVTTAATLDLLLVRFLDELIVYKDGSQGRRMGGGVTLDL